ncbi:hypothetical protein N007_20180 [Alicyclobacillus acidoterrestris ATCC 49025]|nr:hypothetical protein N007_20180 [Alicyclobacillus acidoterrestris ATCC 49025]
MQALEQCAGKPIPGVTINGVKSYTFPKQHLLVTAEDGRITSIQLTTQGSVAQARQAFAKWLPEDVSLAHPVRTGTSGDGTAYQLYHSAALAQALPQARFGAAAPGTFRVEAEPCAGNAVQMFAILGNTDNQAADGVAVNHHATATLPDGTFIDDEMAAHKWENLLLQVQVLGVARGTYEEAIGNHSEVKWHKTLHVHGEPAWFALAEQTPPAAQASEQPTYTYWLIVLRPYPGRSDMNLAYALTGTVAGGNLQAAERAMQTAASGWNFPTK